MKRIKKTEVVEVRRSGCVAKLSAPFIEKSKAMTSLNFFQEEMSRKTNERKGPAKYSNVVGETNELWNRLKVQSFAKTVLSIWSMTALSLYIRVQVNILGRHLYIDTARGLGAAHLLVCQLRVFFTLII
ncbi:hypothetical protein POM88_029134 [Heracleum sosnowskyi]|uniref:Uncharacterized protein n=1 Tax=Heracleum sosnowskyi TaxID=360622 RepID=A0AAD8HU60_9APIA|nr:hypothetical protein POM88_029134 [Heracleum sosnowskyi]